MNDYGSNFNQPKQGWGFAGYIIVSILELFCCGIIWGILGIMFSIQANKAYEEGNTLVFEHKKYCARLCLIIGPLLALVYVLFKTLIV